MVQRHERLSCFSKIAGRLRILHNSFLVMSWHISFYSMSVTSDMTASGDLTQPLYRCVHAAFLIDLTRFGTRLVTTSSDAIPSG